MTIDRTERDLEAVFLALLPQIESLARAAARRQGFRPDEVDEFLGWVKLRFVESEYQQLRSFRSESKMETYLSAVLLNLARDHRRQRAGRFRASAMAKRDTHRVEGDERPDLEDLSALVDGTLDPAQRAAVLDRLDADPDYRATREDLIALRAEAERSPDDSEDESSGPITPVRRPTTDPSDRDFDIRHHVPRWALAVAAVALLAMGTVLLIQRDGDPVARLSRLPRAELEALWSEPVGAVNRGASAVDAFTVGVRSVDLEVAIERGDSRRALLFLDEIQRRIREMPDGSLLESDADDLRSLLASGAPLVWEARSESYLEAVAEVVDADSYRAGRASRVAELGSLGDR